MHGNKTPAPPPSPIGGSGGLRAMLTPWLFRVHGTCASWDHSAELLCRMSPRQLLRPLKDPFIHASAAVPTCAVGGGGAEGLPVLCACPQVAHTIPQGSGTRRLKFLVQDGRA